MREVNQIDRPGQLLMNAKLNARASPPSTWLQTEGKETETVISATDLVWTKHCRKAQSLSSLSLADDFPGSMGQQPESHFYGSSWHEGRRKAFLSCFSSGCFNTMGVSWDGGGKVSSQENAASFQAVIQLQRETLLVVVVFSFSGNILTNVHRTRNYGTLYSSCLTYNFVSHALLLLHTSGTSRVSAVISLLTVRMLHQIIAYYSQDCPTPEAQKNTCS